MRRLAGLGILLFAACHPRAESDPADAPLAQTGSRQVIPVTWTTELDRCFAETDSIYYPSRVRRTARHLWLNDVMANRLVQLTPEGTVVRYIGHRGSGPGEFQSTRSMEIAADGRIAVWDPATTRISYVDTLGGVEQVTIELGSHAEQFVPLADGGAVMVAFRPDSPLVRVDARGRRQGRQAMPWPRYVTLAPIASQHVTAARAADGWGVVALLFGEVFFLLRDGVAVPQAFEYIEPIPAPEIRATLDANGDSVYAMPPMIPMTGVDVAITSRRLLVLFGGRTGPRHRLLDVYDLQSGRYAHSVVLPEALQHFTVWEGAVVGVRMGDRACLRRYRPMAPYDSLFVEGQP